MAIAPRLGRQPFDGVVPVLLFLEHVFIQTGAFGSAGAPDIHANENITVTRHIQIKAPAAQIDLILTVGDVFHDHRQRVFRQVRVGRYI